MAFHYSHSLPLPRDWFGWPNCKQKNRLFSLNIKCFAAKNLLPFLDRPLTHSSNRLVRSTKASVVLQPPKRLFRPVLASGHPSSSLHARCICPACLELERVVISALGSPLPRTLIVPLNAHFVSLKMNLWHALYFNSRIANQHFSFHHYPDLSHGIISMLSILTNTRWSESFVAVSVAKTYEHRYIVAVISFLLILHMHHLCS